MNGSSADKGRVRALRNQTEILSVFGECEAVVARAMAGQYKLHIIEPRDFPPYVSTEDDFGRSVKLAIVMPAQHLVEFHERCARLRA